MFQIFLDEENILEYFKNLNFPHNDILTSEYILKYEFHNADTNKIHPTFKKKEKGKKKNTIKSPPRKRSQNCGLDAMQYDTAPSWL